MTCTSNYFHTRPLLLLQPLLLPCYFIVALRSAKRTCLNVITAAVVAIIVVAKQTAQCMFKKDSTDKDASDFATRDKKKNFE